MTRDDLGRVVRAAWVTWAMTQPNPKPSWLVPYEELSEADQEADRQIGEKVAAVTLRWFLEDMNRAARQPGWAELIDQSYPN